VSAAPIEARTRRTRRHILKSRGQKRVARYHLDRRADRRLRSVEDAAIEDGEMTEATGTYLFLTGADMDPTKVRRAYPEGTFVARGHTEAHAGEIAPEFAQVLAGPGVGDVWGILVQVPNAYGDNERRHQVTADDGRTFTAVVIGERMAAGLAPLVLKAAHYWELPAGYVGRLKMATPKLGREGSDED
jgi:hypothetical protein